MYINEPTHNLNGNSSHSQPTNPTQSEELYKRSVTLVIWYKVSWSAHCLVILILLIYNYIGSYNSSPPVAPSAHLPVSSALSVSFPTIIALAD